MNAMDNSVGHPAGISAPSSNEILPLFPSDAQFVQLVKYADLRQVVLDVVEREHAHLSRNWADIENILWGALPSSLSRQFSRWHPDQRGRRMGERFRALIKHFSSFNSTNESDFEKQVKRMVIEMEEQKTALAEKK